MYIRVKKGIRRTIKNNPNFQHVTHKNFRSEVCSMHHVKITFGQQFMKRSILQIQGDYHELKLSVAQFSHLYWSLISLAYILTD